MLTAFACWILFTVFPYLVYHYHVGLVPFKGQGSIRPVDFTILLSHTILAVTVVPTLRSSRCAVPGRKVSGAFGTSPAGVSDLALRFPSPE